MADRQRGAAHVTKAQSTQRFAPREFRRNRSTPMTTSDSSRKRSLFTLFLLAILPTSGLHAATIVTDPVTTDTPLFIQLLGINNAGTIVGYTGMGTPNPNRGIILTLPNTFTSLNPNLT